MISRENPITRKEMYLNSLSGGAGIVPSEPITRQEMYLAKAIGQDVNTPTPITREEMYLEAIAQGGGGGGSGYTIEDVGTHAYAKGNITYLADFAFPYTFANSNVESFYAPNLIRFSMYGANTGGPGTSVFLDCKNLTSVSMPKFETGGSGGSQFSGCIKLQTINFPKMAAPGQFMFNGCTSLVTAVFGQNAPQMYSMNNSAFLGCSKLEAVDISNVTKTGTGEFNNCTRLNVLIIRRQDDITALSSTNVFTNTPFASGKAGGTLYVPQSLISTYQNAANWSTILGYANNKISPIEGSIYETQYADGTPIT